VEAFKPELVAPSPKLHKLGVDEGERRKSAEHERRKSAEHKRKSGEHEQERKSGEEKEEEQDQEKRKSGEESALEVLDVASKRKSTESIKEANAEAAEEGDQVPDMDTLEISTKGKGKAIPEEDIPEEFRGMEDIPTELLGMDDAGIKGYLADDMKNLKAFSHLSPTMRDELCRVLDIQFFDSGEYVFKQGDVGTKWYVIYKGSVDVVVNGVTVVSLGEGDGFGELALITEKPRAASIMAKEDGCQFLVIDKVDYLNIQEQISTNTIKLEEHGKVVLVMEKREKKKGGEADSTQPSAPPAAESSTPTTPTTPTAPAAHTRSVSFNSMTTPVSPNSPTPPSGAASPTAATASAAQRKDTQMVVVAGTIDRLVQRLTEDWDESFVLDFLLSFRQFLTTQALWESMLLVYNSAEASPAVKSRAIEVIDKWIRGHPNDFRQDGELQDIMLKFYLKLKALSREHYDRVHSAIIYQRLDPSVKGRSSSFSSTISRSFSGSEPKTKRRSSAVSELWRKSINKISRRKSNDFNATQEEDPRQVFKALIPATQWVKVYLRNEDYKTLSVSPTMPASEIVSLVIEKFRLSDPPGKFILCEVRLNESEPP